MESSEQMKLILSSRTKTVEIDNRIPLSHYYRIARNLLKQSRVYREEDNIIELYVTLVRFSSLVSETIPRHQDYKIYKGKEKDFFKAASREVLNELETLKPKLQRYITELDKQQTSILPGPRLQNEKNVWSHHLPSNKGLDTKQLQENLAKSSFHLQPNKETIMKHSYLRSDFLQGQEESPKIQSKVEYPVDIDTSPVNIPQSHQEDDFSSMSTANTSSSNYHSQIARQPPSPVVSYVERLPPEFNVHAQISEYENDSRPELVNTPSNHLSSSVGLKHVQLSPRMMETFLKIAEPNTEKNLETCGVLAGSLKQHMFFVTTLIIPKQQSTSDSCDTLDEAEIYAIQDERSLFPLGWIHTHPSQSCFMSSVDLHTQYSYQVMLPEAIAIVMAPTDSARYGIFHLTEPDGMRVLRHCQQRGFHLHEDLDDGSPAYEHCTHVLMNPKIKFDIIDLR